MTSPATIDTVGDVTIVPRSGRAAFVATIAGIVRGTLVASGRKRRMGTTTVPERAVLLSAEARYVLSRAGWQLESLAITGHRYRTDNTLSKQHVHWHYQDADAAVDGPLSAAPEVILAWAIEHNPGNFPAVPYKPDTGH